MSGKAEEPKQGAPEWMVTYSDVISLLVTFFVMLLTFSTSNREDFDKAAGSLQGALGVGTDDAGRLAQSGFVTDRFLLGGRSTPVGVDTPPETEPLDWENADLNSRLKNEKFGAPITLHTLSRGTLIRIRSSVIFMTDSEIFTTQGKEYLKKFTLAVKEMSNKIEIFSYIGSDYPRGTQAGWLLTQARSAKIADFLVANGVDAARLSVGGMGDARPLRHKPILGDDRIEITLLNSSK